MCLMCTHIFRCTHTCSRWVCVTWSEFEMKKAETLRFNNRGESFPPSGRTFFTLAWNRNVFCQSGSYYNKQGGKRMCEGKDNVMDSARASWKWFRGFITAWKWKPPTVQSHVSSQRGQSVTFLLLFLLLLLLLFRLLLFRLLLLLLCWSL